MPIAVIGVCTRNRWHPWRQAAKDANEKPVLTLKEQEELEKLRVQDQREIQPLRKELQRRSPAQGNRADQRGSCRGCEPGQRLRRDRNLPAHPSALAEGS